MARASGQQEDREIVPGTRGDIVDRHGSVLAMSVRGYALMARRAASSPIPTRSAARVCGVLDSADAARAIARWRRRCAPVQRPRVWLSVPAPRDLADEEVAKIDALNEPALRAVEARSTATTRTARPRRTCSASSTSTTTARPASSWRSEKRIAGKPGKQIVQVMALRAAHAPVERACSNSRPPARPSRPRSTASCSSWSSASWRRRSPSTTPTAACVIVMDPWNGDILAMANAPTFDPNDVGRLRAGAAAEPRAQHIYEPGSTFKMVTAAAALSKRHMPSTRMYDVQPRLDPLRQPRRSTTSTTTRAGVHRRLRQVEQRRRDQDRPRARPRGDQPLRQPLRLRRE